MALLPGGMRLDWRINSRMIRTFERDKILAS